MIIIVFGLPGSGKSFFAQRLAKEINAAYYSTDKIRKKIIANPVYNKDEKYFLYHHILDETDFKKTTIIDGTFYKEELRSIFYTKAEQLQQEIFFIEITASEELIKIRTSKLRKDSDADYTIYKKIKEEFEPMNENHLLLESKESNIKEMINTAIGYLNSLK